LELARASRQLTGLNAYFCISTANEIFSEFQMLGTALFPIDTFQSAAGALYRIPNLIGLRRRITSWLREREIERVVILMPHVWTPFLASSIRRLGIHYTVIIHDSQPHPGDSTGLIFEWLLNDARVADTIITLSPWVRDKLVKRGVAPNERTRTLLMPDVTFPAATLRLKDERPRRRSGQPLRILFFGRMLKYKGLSLFVDALEILTDISVPLEISVCGEGDISDVASRLKKLGAVIVNRWISDEEVGELLYRHDVVVLTHTEASQSGVVSAAMGAVLPVVTTPVGGLAHQVKSRHAGLVAARADSRAVADCIRSLALDCDRYNHIVDQIRRCRGFLMTEFLQSLIEDAAPQRENVMSGERPPASLQSSRAKTC
jgi:glycosyltransferase involved in cell wall biosynthesis